MSSFLDKIFGSKIEIDLAKIGLESELCFEHTRMDIALGKGIADNQHNDLLKLEYTDLLLRMTQLKKDQWLTIGKELDLLRQYIALWGKVSIGTLFIRVETFVDVERELPALILFPLVANAIQQGYNSMENYPVKVKVKANEYMLNMEISNRVNHHILSQEATVLIDRYKQRLLELLPDKHTLFFNSNSNTFKAILQIRW